MVRAGILIGTSPSALMVDATRIFSEAVQLELRKYAAAGAEAVIMRDGKIIRAIPTLKDGRWVVE